MSATEVIDRLLTNREAERERRSALDNRWIAFPKLVGALESELERQQTKNECRCFSVFVLIFALQMFVRTQSWDKFLYEESLKQVARVAPPPPAHYASLGFRPPPQPPRMPGPATGAHIPALQLPHGQRRAHLPQHFL